jgi:hypothetical protein
MGSGGIAPPFLTSALDGDEWSTSLTGRFSPKERDPGTHWIVGWVGPEPVWMLWSREKSFFPTRNRNPAVQPEAHRYTHRAIPAPYCF